MIDLPMKVNIQDSDVDIFYRDFLIAKARRGRIMPTKVKMTRAEAIARVSEFVVNIKTVEDTVDFYIEAGMLEVVEEPEKLTYAEVIAKVIGTDHLYIDARLKEYGYKIVKIDA